MKPLLHFKAVICLSLFAIQVQGQVPISPMYFGQNYFFTSPTVPPTTGTYMSPAIATMVAESGVKLVRYGGIHLATGWDGGAFIDLPDQIHYQKVVEDTRTNLKAEPLLQMPFKPNFEPAYSSAPDAADIAYWASYAAQIVDHLNNDLKLNIKYWQIANEPDNAPNSGYNYTNGTTADAQFIANYIQAISKAMKDKDPNIIIVAPSLNYINTADINDPHNKLCGFLFSNPSNTYSIAGSFVTAWGLTRYYVDRLDVHVYPSINTVDPWNQSIVPQTKQRAYAWGSFHNTLNSLVTNFITGSGRNLSNLKILITEFNARGNLDLTTGNMTDAAALANTANNYDMRTFAGGQQIADMLAAGLDIGNTTDNGVDGMMMWSVREGKGDSDPNNRGYIGITGSNKRPSFYHYKMMSTYFKRGLFYRGFENNSSLNSFPTAGNLDVKAFAADVSGEYMAVMVMNNNVSGPIRNYDIHLNSTNNTWSTTDIRINFPRLVTYTGSNGKYNSTIDPLTTVLILFDCNGLPIIKYTYKQTTATLDPFTNNVVSLNTNPFIPITITGTTNSCAGSASGSAIASASGATSFTWYNSFGQNIGTGSTISNLFPGLFKVVVTFASSCSSSAYVIINTTAPAINAGTDDNDCSGSAVIGDPDNPVSGFIWTQSPTGIPPTGQNPTVTPPVTTTYYITTTTACVVSDAVTVSSGADLYIRDTPLDDGAEPNLGQPWNLVDGTDVWVRNLQATPIPGPTPHYTFEHQHEDVDWKGAWQTNFSTHPYIYVKVRNRGCNPVTGTLRLYYHRVSTNDEWITPCTGIPITWDCGDWREIICGDTNGDGTIGVGETACTTENDITLLPGEEGVIEQVWNSVRDNAIFTDPTASPFRTHWCLLARLESTADPMNLEQSGVSAANNAQQENNIVQKNVAFIDNPPGIICDDGLEFGNVSEVPTGNRLDMVDMSSTLFTPTNGLISVDLGETLYNEWVAGGKIGSGITCGKGKYIHTSNGRTHTHDRTSPDEKPYTINLVNSTAFIGNITLPSFETHPLCIEFNYYQGDSSTVPFQYSFRQYESKSSGSALNFTGAVKYYINKPDCPPANAGTNVTIGRNCSATLSANPSVQNAIYKWYNNATGALVGTGQTIQVSPRSTTTYEVEMKFPNGCISYAVVTVTVNPKQTCHVVECPKIDFINKIIRFLSRICGLCRVEACRQVCDTARLRSLDRCESRTFFSWSVSLCR